MLTILFHLFFLIIHLYFLIPAVIEQNFNSAGELVMPTRIATKESKAEMETHPETVNAEMFNII